MRLPFDVPFAEAVEHFRDAIALTREAYDRLDAWAKKRAFTIAHVAKAQVLQDFRDEMRKAIARGTTLADFQAAAREIGKRNGWGGTTPWHLETVFRTNSQFAYGSGRRDQQLAVIDYYPFLLLDEVDDSRTRRSHAEVDGTVLPQEDPFWVRWYPPSDFNCRGMAEELTTEEAQAMGITDVTSLRDYPDNGFTSPGSGGDYEPNLDALDGDLADLVRSALRDYDNS